MANNVKYTFSFYGETGTHYKADIRKKGYAGASTTVGAGSSPIVITWESVDTWWNPVHPSTCVARINSSTNFQFKEFFDAVYEDYQIEITNVATSAVIWIGYNEPGLYSEQYVTTPYYIEMTFTDGLEHLKNLEFKQSGGSAFDAQMHVIEVLRHCLNSIGSDYTAGPKNILEVVNIYEEDMTDGVANSPLVQLFVAASTYRKVKEHIEEYMSKHAVISAILKSIGCFVVQAGGLWYIIRVKEYKETALTYRLFTPHVGTESNTATASNGTISHVVNEVKRSSLTSANVVMLEQSGVLGMRNRSGRAVVQYRPNDYYYINGSLLRNPEFYSDYGIDTTTRLPMHWTRSGGLSTANGTSTNILGVKRRLQPLPTGFSNIIETSTSSLIVTPQGASLHGDFLIRFDNSISAIDATKYISSISDRIFINAADKVMVRWRFKLITYIQSTILITPVKVILTDLSGPTVYYLNWDGSWTTTDNGWMQFNNYPPDNQYMEAAHGSNVMPFTGEAKVEYQLAMPFIPTGGGSGGMSYFDFLSIDYIVSGTGRPINEKIYIKEIDTLHDSYQIEVKHGDGPDYVSGGSFRLSDDSITNQWHRFATVETVGLEEILLDDVLSLLSNFPKTWSGVLRSGGVELWPYNKIYFSESIPPSATQTFDFAPFGMTYDLQNSTYDVSMGEIAEVAYSETDIETGGDGGSPPEENPTGYGGGNTPQDQIYAPTGTPKAIDQNKSFPG